MCYVSTCCFTVLDNLLALIEQLGQQRMEAKELQSILQLFQHSHIPMVSTIHGLGTVVLTLCLNLHTYLRLEHNLNP